VASGVLDCGSTNEAIILDYSGDSVQMIAGQPGWRELLQVDIPREVWRLLAPDLVELHPNLEDAMEIVGDGSGVDEYELDADWQSVFNLTAILGGADSLDDATEIVNAWKRQPQHHRKVPWLQNGGNARVAAAQLLGTVRPPEIPFQTTVKPWMLDLVGVATTFKVRLAYPSATMTWIGARTPLGTTCIPEFEVERAFFSANPTFSTCPVWFGSEHNREAEVTWEALDGLRRLQATFKKGLRNTGHNVMSIERELAVWSNLLRH